MVAKLKRTEPRCPDRKQGARSSHSSTLTFRWIKDATHQARYQGPATKTLYGQSFIHCDQCQKDRSRGPMTAEPPSTEQNCVLPFIRQGNHSQSIPIVLASITAAIIFIDVGHGPSRSCHCRLREAVLVRGRGCLSQLFVCTKRNFSGKQIWDKHIPFFL